MPRPGANGQFAKNAPLLDEKCLYTMSLKKQEETLGAIRRALAREKEGLSAMRRMRAGAYVEGGTRIGAWFRRAFDETPCVVKNKRGEKETRYRVSEAGKKHDFANAEIARIKSRMLRAKEAISVLEEEISRRRSTSVHLLQSEAELKRIAMESDEKRDVGYAIARIKSGVALLEIAGSGYNASLRQQTTWFAREAAAGKLGEKRMEELLQGRGWGIEGALDFVKSQEALLRIAFGAQERDVLKKAMSKLDARHLFGILEMGIGGIEKERAKSQKSMQMAQRAGEIIRRAIVELGGSRIPRAQEVVPDEKRLEVWEKVKGHTYRERQKVYQKEREKEERALGGASNAPGFVNLSDLERVHTLVWEIKDADSEYREIRFTLSCKAQSKGHMGLIKRAEPDWSKRDPHYYEGWITEDYSTDPKLIEAREKRDRIERQNTVWIADILARHVHDDKWVEDARKAMNLYQHITKRICKRVISKAPEARRIYWIVNCAGP